MQQQTALNPLSPQEIQWMVKNGDHRNIGELRRLHRRGVDVRADSPAYQAQEPTTTIKSNAPAQPKPAASTQSLAPAPLTDHQAQVLKNVMGHRQWLMAQQPGSPAPAAQSPQQKASKHEFMTQAKRISVEQSIPLSKAMGELARRDPALHQRFLQEVNA